MKRKFMYRASSILAILATVHTLLLPVSAGVGLPVTGDERGGIMRVVVILLIVSVVLIVVFLALSGKKKKKK